jgi:DNA-binding NarL/FixJ family response regulator
MVNVIIADSNELIREGLKAIINREKGMKLIAECSDREHLLSAITRQQPHVVMIDFSSPGFTVDVILDIKKVYPDIQIAAITFSPTGQAIISAMKAGITAYVKKDCDIAEIVDSVYESAKGNKFFCGSILETIKNESIDINKAEFRSLVCAPVAITERELEIITLIAEGFTNAEIAEKLFLSTHTVNTHRKNIMSKLGVTNTAGIVMYAVKCNLVSPNKYLFAAH